MSQQIRKKKTKGCLIPGIILGLIVIAILGLVIGLIFLVLSFVYGPSLTNYTKKVNLVTVKENMSNASTVIAGNLIMDKMSTQEAAKKAIDKLNKNDTPGDTSDDLYSPYSPSLSAFDTKPGPGVVVIEAVDSKKIVITGYNKNLKPLAKKIILTNEKKDDIKFTDEKYKEE